MGSNNTPNNDLLNGDPSLLLLYAVNSETINEKDKTRILSIYNGESMDLDVNYIRRVYEETGALQSAIKKMREFAEKARIILNLYPDCEAKQSLLVLLNQFNHNFTENFETISLEFIKV